MEHRERLETVYVHCKAGRTRGPTLVACYLMVVSFIVHSNVQKLTVKGHR